MYVRVKNDREMTGKFETVYEGSLLGFLARNDYDPDVIEECKKLKEQNSIDIYMLSGVWQIEKMTDKEKLEMILDEMGIYCTESSYGLTIEDGYEDTILLAFDPVTGKYSG